MNKIKSLNALIPSNITLEEDGTWCFNNELISTLELAIPQLESEAFLDLCNYGESLIVPTWFMLVKEEKLLNTLLERPDINFILNEYAYSKNKDKMQSNSQVYAKFPRENVGLTKDMSNPPYKVIRNTSITMTYAEDLIGFPMLYQYDAQILKKLLNAGLILTPHYPSVFLTPKFFLSILEENIFSDEKMFLNHIKELTPKGSKNILELFYWYNKDWKDSNDSLSDGYYMAQAFLLTEKNNYDSNLKIHKLTSPSTEKVIEEGYYQQVLKIHDPELYDIMQTIVLEEKLTKDLPNKKAIKNKKL